MGAEGKFTWPHPTFSSLGGTRGTRCGSPHEIRESERESEIEIESQSDKVRLRARASEGESERGRKGGREGGSREEGRDGGGREKEHGSRWTALGAML